MNTCRFVPMQNSSEKITTLNFVCERGDSVNKGPFTFSFYRIYFVACGECTVRFDSSSFTAKENDVFIVFPAVEYSFECSEDIQLLYVSFIGMRNEAVLSRLHVTKSKSYFENMSKLRSMWEQAFDCEPEFLDLASESVVLYSFTEMGNRVAQKKKSYEKYESSDSMLFVKKYIDENFTKPSLSLDSVSEKFKYNKKYLSHHFKAVLGYGVTEYINLIRINHACSLIEQNHRFVQDISFNCGYKDPFYFSRVFKKLTGCSPKEMIKMKNNQING